MEPDPAGSGRRQRVRECRVVASPRSLLYSARMSAQATVVKRARRRTFAAPRALPAWLRVLRLALFGSGIDRLRGSPGEKGRALGETPWVERPRRPRLARKANGPHRCTGCGLCVRVCPGRCLEIEVDAGTGSAGVPVHDPSRLRAFVLQAGSCIGCSLCDEVCPERAIEMVDAPPVVPGPPAGPLASGREGIRFDLLNGGD
ncbi:MAG TPA: 4Fe-4S dicluster domain-containing protein [Deltaproteobacteria bacterium]|nr:4Fe-4S dicluster domain-containing protein [Deltaproteobacteria bacterium]